MKTQSMGRAGVSLVELLVAVVVLSAGIMGMAAGTSWTVQMVASSRLDTARAAAIQSAVEEMKAVPLADLASDRIYDGDYVTSVTVTDRTAISATVRLVMVGPGRTSSGNRLGGAISDYAADTLTYIRVR